MGWHTAQGPGQGLEPGAAAARKDHVVFVTEPNQGTSRASSQGEMLKKHVKFHIPIVLLISLPEWVGQRYPDIYSEHIMNDEKKKYKVI